MKTRQGVINISYSIKKKILFSGRDPGAVGHLLPIIEEFRNSGKFEVTLLASSVAYEMLSLSGETPILFKMSDGRDYISQEDDPNELLALASIMLKKYEPDAVFTSLSSLGVGVDEALLSRTRVHSFAMQEFWGDVNLGLGTPANLYFVIDEYAENLTRKRWGVEASAVGAPKYTKYKHFDIHEMKWSARELLGGGKNKKVVGYFGQSPDIPGHESVFHDFIQALKNLPLQPFVLLREHPKFYNISGTEHCRMLAENNINFKDVTNQSSTETWLSVCDLVVTPFSLCGLDHAYLSAFSSEPLGSVLYLTTNKEIRKFIFDSCGLEHFPTVDNGIGRVVNDIEALEEAILSGLSEKTAVEYFRASKSLSSESPSRNIVKKVWKSLTI